MPISLCSVGGKLALGCLPSPELFSPQGPPFDHQREKLFLVRSDQNGRGTIADIQFGAQFVKFVLSLFSLITFMYFFSAAHCQV